MGPISLLFSQAARNEGKFRDWYEPMARQTGMDPNPDAPEHFYDMRGLFFDSGGKAGPQRGHFPSKYKREGHPRTFLDDTQGRIFDTRTATYLDGSPVPRHLLRASEQSPDMPGFDPNATPRPHGGMLEPESVFAPRRGVGPRPFRDPEQMGPAPPTDGPIASLYRKRK